MSVCSCDPNSVRVAIGGYRGLVLVQFSLPNYRAALRRLATSLRDLPFIGIDNVEHSRRPIESAAAVFHPAVFSFP